MSDQIELIDGEEKNDEQQLKNEVVDQYSDFSEGDQYDSDDGPIDNRKDPEKRPFKQIKIDHILYEPVQVIPPTKSSENNNEIYKQKISLYQQWLLKQQLSKAAIQQQQSILEQQITKDETEEQNKIVQMPIQEQVIQNINGSIQVQISNPTQTTQLTSGYQISQEELVKLIFPWSVHFDKTWKKNYYFNGLTNESSWELPEDIIKKVQEYRKQFEHRVHDFEERNMYKFLPRNFVYQQRILLQQNREKCQQRPARKQVEESIATKYAYRQGDEEYNIWFDKFLSDGNKYKDRDAALTRCNPEADCGYTKADLYEKFSSYFCLHFSRGCCCEGVNCKFYHRIPSIQESEQIDLSKDIFGRSRYQKNREDMQGIGVFSHDTKSLYITHYKLPKADNHTQALALMYEIFWRHFGVFGDIDDINILQAKGACFMRFKHRCQAEFAKEALQAQALDEQEILTVKWANDDPNPKAISRVNEEKKIRVVQAHEKNQQRKFNNQAALNQTRQRVPGNQVVYFYLINNPLQTQIKRQ